jgi:hypothetical protein
LSYLRKFLGDKLFRRFLIASGFAGAFVWVAVDAFGVRTEVIVEFFVLSIILVMAMVVVALPVALLLRYLRSRKRSLSFETLIDSTEEKDSAQE